MYRKFHLDEADAGDDYHSMKEITYRRYSRLKEEGLSYPDLILVDGGITQVHACLEALTKAGVTIPVYGLYKNDKHQTEGIIDQNEKTYPLDNRSPLFFLLMPKSLPRRRLISPNKPEKIRPRECPSGHSFLFPFSKNALGFRIRTMDSLKSLLDKKQYDLILSLTEGSLDPEALVYRISAYLGKGDSASAQDLFFKNRDLLWSFNPVLTIKSNFELRFIAHEGILHNRGRLCPRQ